MSQPAPKFFIGQRARIVGCTSHPQCNGRIVELIEGPLWVENWIPLPNGEFRIEPSCWAYRVDGAGVDGPEWVGESELAPIGDSDRPATWQQIAKDTGWAPNRVKVK